MKKIKLIMAKFPNLTLFMFILILSALAGIVLYFHQENRKTIAMITAAIGIIIGVIFRVILYEILLISRAKKILKKNQSFVDLKILIENVQQANFGNTSQIENLKNWLADFKEYSSICEAYPEIEKMHEQLEKLQRKISKNSMRKVMLEKQLGIY